MPTTQTKFEIVDITSEQAHTQMALQPIQMVYEAREALHKIKESDLSPEDLVQLVEPVSRAIGWAEALVFAFEKTTEREVFRSLVQNGATSNPLQKQQKSSQN